MRHIVIIGAGQAGLSVALTLRNKGFDGQITLVGDEDLPPYQRPPLSKAFLLGKIDEDRLLLKPAAFYKDQNIALRLGVTVEAIRPDQREVLAGGERLTYDALVLATGSEPRRLPAAMGGDLGNVHVLRSHADARRLGPELQAGRRLLMVGGGYIGLEVAAVARERGLEVTVLEAAPRILQRVAAPETADFFRALHMGHGVTLIEGTGLATLLGDTVVTGAALADGHRMAADLVVLGIGVTPRTALAEMAGLTIENGIRTDSRGRTSDPHIWAVGDCCSLPWHGGRIRLESVPNAVDQGVVVATNILGEAMDYDAQPWFWSDQYDVKLQTAGLSLGYDRSLRRDRQRGGTSCAVWYFRDGRAIAVDAMNDPRTYMAARRAFRLGNGPDYDAVADPAFAL